jgi:hypothetical protein
MKPYVRGTLRSAKSIYVSCIQQIEDNVISFETRFRVLICSQLHHSESPLAAHLHGVGA